MKTRKLSNKDLYFTNDHEWIDFQGAVAYVGVCPFKLSGIKEVHQVIFSKDTGFMKKADLIATIKYNDYLIDAHMPVDGKVVQLNENLLDGEQNLLLLQPESMGWIAKIVPAQPYERKGLLLSQQYQMNGKGKYAK